LTKVIATPNDYITPLDEVNYHYDCKYKYDQQ